MKLTKSFACLLSLGLLVNHVIAQTASQLNPSIESKVDRLLKQMTLEEKVGQMAQVSIRIARRFQRTGFYFF
jgi:beta-glucosidase